MYVGGRTCLKCGDTHEVGRHMTVKMLDACPNCGAESLLSVDQDKEIKKRGIEAMKEFTENSYLRQA